MQIAVDASRLDIVSPTGTQNYLYNLIHHLSVIDKSNTYFICFRQQVSQDWFNELVSENVNFKSVYIKKTLSWTQFDFAKYLMKNNFDLLISPWQTIPIIHKSNLKIVSVIHGLEYKKYGFAPTLFTVRFSDYVVAVSEFTKSEISSRFKVNAEKVGVIGEGVDTKFFYKRSEREIENVLSKYKIDSKNYILFVGTAVKRKNLNNMIEAFSRVINERVYESLRFVIAGSVPEDNLRLYELPETYNVKDCVKFTGRVDQLDLPALISGAQFLSYVSLSEGFGLPVLEAMACEVPVLTSTTGALPEVSGGAALCVNPNNINEIFQGMDLLLKDYQLRKKLIDLGLVNIQKYSWRQCAEEFLNSFKNI